MHAGLTLRFSDRCFWQECTKAPGGCEALFGWCWSFGLRVYEELCMHGHCYRQVWPCHSHRRRHHREEQPQQAVPVPGLGYWQVTPPSHVPAQFNQSTSPHLCILICISISWNRYKCLFEPRSYKSTVAAVAANAINPGMHIRALQNRVSPETETVFNDQFWEVRSAGCTQLLHKQQLLTYLGLPCF